ncbi:membrane protein insertion efficiency factor YidD [Vibrio coralliirubri]|uniref:membrane protein insertion efficiency factor YidD n=1 Tax=Vibrio coralliirubri TaxID=1516159 RepID=UPI0022836875|nr:membrane protein insertion efficiency factor YidD [Vibrio coralliirubri]MCY9865003.1 membrane protein insertion efficiency factor YidD [Vibrio coralliirubri]
MIKKKQGGLICWWYYSDNNSFQVRECPLLSWISLRGIAFYQKFISPRKGYRCAYGVLNNTQGCSGMVKDIILQNGVVGGWKDITSQFSECNAAAAKLQEQSSCKKKRRSCKSRFRKEANCGSTKCSNSCHVPDCGDCGDMGSCDVGSC